MIPMAPALACAYFQRDGKFRSSLPLEGTPYSGRGRGQTQLTNEEGAAK